MIIPSQTWANTFFSTGTFLATGAVAVQGDKTHRDDEDDADAQKRCSGQHEVPVERYEELQLPVGGLVRRIGSNVELGVDKHELKESSSDDNSTS